MLPLAVSSSERSATSSTGWSNWDQTQYHPWGQVQAGQSPSETQGFGTYVQDIGSGLYYADQRYYKQSWGRCQTPDPFHSNLDVGNPGSWNRYAYTNGDPVNGFDPRGLYDDDDGDSDDGDVGGGGVADPGQAGGDTSNSSPISDTAEIPSSGGAPTDLPPDSGNPTDVPPASPLAPTPTTIPDVLGSILIGAGEGLIELIGAAALVILNPVSAGGKEELCWEQYMRDIDVCRALE